MCQIQYENDINVVARLILKYRQYIYNLKKTCTKLPISVHIHNSYLRHCKYVPVFFYRN